MLAGANLPHSTGWAAFKRGLINRIQALTGKDAFTGIQPLPPGMTGHVAAIAIVVSITTASLVYGDDYLDGLWTGRLIASNELDQKTAHLPKPKSDEPEPSQTEQQVPPPAPEADPVPQPKPRLEQMGEPFIERFRNETLDERYWYISDGWSNGDHMDNDWRRSQIDTGKDGLVITMEKARAGHPKALVSGEARTLPFYRYGYFEALARVPRGAGVVSGIFTYAHIDGNVRPNEIDIEILGKDTRTLETSIHQNGVSTLKRVRLPFDAAEGFHTWGIDWQPDYVRWYADGQLVHEDTSPVVAGLTRPQQFIFDLWGSTPLHQWVGPFDKERGPWKLEITCAAYEPKYPGRELCK